MIVLVSGSWMPSLAPLASALDIQHILCSEIDRDGDTITGHTTRVLVGPEKATAITSFASNHHIDLAESSAYGDDPTDQWMLATTGNPVIVGNDPRLHSIATTRRWPVLSTTQ
jgi:putative phosphoserine phosphatase/1-acylglycerol-3-phosphate O-acyltransferase